MSSWYSIIRIQHKSRNPKLHEHCNKIVAHEYQHEQEKVSFPTKDIYLNPIVQLKRMGKWHNSNYHLREIMFVVSFSVELKEKRQSNSFELVVI